MKPFLRASNRGKLAPVGWVSEPAGRWAGSEADVVYDPHRHDVLLVRNDPGENARLRFREIGYRRVADDGKNELWVRDRSAAVSARMDQVEGFLGGEQRTLGSRSL